MLNNVYNLSDLVDVALPTQPASHKGSDEGEIHITHDHGRVTMVLCVPNREEVYKVCNMCKLEDMPCILMIIFFCSIFWIVKRTLILISLILSLVFVPQMFQEEY